MNSDQNWDERLLEFARLERETYRQRTALLEERDQLYSTLVLPLDNQIEALSAGLIEADQKLRADLLEYMSSTGDLNVHPSVQFRRTKKLVYDKEEVLQQLLDEGIERPIRTKRELNVREFEKAWRNGEYHFVNAEEVSDPTIAIGKLGDLLIAVGEEPV